MLLSPRVVLHQSNHSSGQALQGGVGRECVLGKSQVLSSWVRLRDKCQPSPWAVISKVPVAHLGGYAAGASLSPANSSPSRQLVDILEPESVTLQTLALISFPLAEQFLVWYKVHPLKSRGNLLAKFQGIISPGKLSLSHQAAHLAGVFKKKKNFSRLRTNWLDCASNRAPTGFQKSPSIGRQAHPVQVRLRSGRDSSPPCRGCHSSST